MPDQIPPGCVDLKTHLNSLNTQLAALKQALAEADPADKVQAQKAVGKKQQEVNIAQVAFNNCLANPPLVTVPPGDPQGPGDPQDPGDPQIPGVPNPCLGLYKQLNGLRAHLAALQESLNTGGEGDPGEINRQIGLTKDQIRNTQLFFDNCVIENRDPIFATPPKETMPGINPDTSLREVVKTIPWALVQKKMDELFNHRTLPPIVTIRLHNHPFVPPPGVPNTPQPATDLTISKINAVVIAGQISTKYDPIFHLDLGQLFTGYYINDLNVSSITMAVDGSSPEPLTLKVAFECGGAEEIITNTFGLPNFNLSQLDVSIKLTIDVVRSSKPVPAACNSIQADIDDMKNTVAELQLEMQNPNTNHANLAQQINAWSVKILARQKDLDACLTANGGPDPLGTGRLDLLSWMDKIKDLKDDALDEAIKKYIVLHVSADTIIDGIVQKYARKAIYDKINSVKMRETLSKAVSNWILGGDGTYDVMSVDASDGQNAVIKYLVPANKLDPFPESVMRPADWPYKGNPNPTATLPVTNSNSLGNIKHIVVLTMENRSFDHMLGYLSLPVSAGGMGRTDVDGLTGPDVNFNPMNGVHYPIFPFAQGDTAFPIDPYHSYEPVANQMNGELDETDKDHPFFKPGSAKMDGFVKNFLDKSFMEAAPKIMGYQPPANVPVYDALTRDFAISDRWFSAHPGPTFSNRFYELTGRLNLSNGLPLGNFGHPADTWEFNNSSPLTPVFNKTIFDYLSEYQKTIERAVTWKYYEHDYTFLRFFSNHTFDNKNIVRIDDPVNGFFADAKNGTLPSVSYIDPQFVELPPNSNCDGPVADIKPGQDLVRRVVEAVITSPQYATTLLVITYDEHGGFYDHVPPPAAMPFTPDFPIKTYGVRIPAFFISPWVKAGSVIGRDANGAEKYHFDTTSILKTIAARMMSKNPPYMSARFADAQELSVVLDKSPRKPQFLPFIRYNLKFNASNFMLNVPGSAPGVFLTQAQAIVNGSPTQDFSFEVGPGGMTYIRTNVGNLYLTINAATGGLIQDVKYPVDNFKCQLWRLTALGTTGAAKNSFVIINDLFLNKVLQPQSNSAGAQLALVNKPATVVAANTWTITCPLIS